MSGTREELRAASRGYFDARAHGPRTARSIHRASSKGWAVERPRSSRPPARSASASTPAATSSLVASPSPRAAVAGRIRHPDEPDRVAVVVLARDLAVATSAALRAGRSRHRSAHRSPAQRGSQRDGHRTELAEANAYATAAFAMGAGGLAWIAGLRAMRAARSPPTQLTWTPGFERYRARRAARPGPEPLAESAIDSTIRGMRGAVLRPLAARLVLAALDRARSPCEVDPCCPARAASAALPRWTGGVDLYRAGVFTTQKTGCGARRPTSRSCATSPTTRRTTRRRASSATSTTCGRTTATRSRSPTAWTRPAGPPGSAATSTLATGSWRAELRLPPSGRPSEPAADEPAGRDHRRPRQPRLGPDRLHRDRRPGGNDPLHRHERPRRRPAVGPPEPLVRLRHAARHEADAAPAQGVLHAVALRRDPDGLGGRLGLGPADRRLDGAGPDGEARSDRATDGDPEAEPDVAGPRLAGPASPTPPRRPCRPRPVRPLPPATAGARAPPLRRKRFPRRRPSPRRSRRLTRPPAHPKSPPRSPRIRPRQPIRRPG